MTEYKVNADKVARRVAELLVLARSVWQALGAVNEAGQRQLSDDDRESIATAVMSIAEANTLALQAHEALPDDQRFKTLLDKTRTMYPRYYGRLLSPPATVVEVIKPLEPVKPPVIRHTGKGGHGSRRARISDTVLYSIVQDLSEGQPNDMSFNEWCRVLGEKHGVSKTTVWGKAASLGVKPHK